MEFLLQHVDVYTDQNDCSLQICITKRDHSNCIHTIECNITLPASDIPNNISYVEPVHLQWIPINDDVGHLIISNFNEEVCKLVGNIYIFVITARKVQSISMKWSVMDLK